MSNVVKLAEAKEVVKNTYTFTMQTRKSKWRSRYGESAKTGP